MISELIGITLAASPALIGFFIGAALAYRFCTDIPGAWAVLAGACGFLGYLVLALFIRWQDAAGAMVFSPLLLEVLGWLLLVSVAVFFWSRASSRKVFTPGVIAGATRSRPRGIADCLLMFFLTLLAGQTLLQVAITPVNSWDGLGLWTTWAEYFLQFDQQQEDLVLEHRVFKSRFAVPRPSPLVHPRHPPTVFHLSAFAGFTLQETNLLRGWLVPWTSILLSGAAAIWGFCRALTTPLSTCFLALLGYFSLPLLEHHSILVGYADVWVAMSFTLAVSLVVMGIIHRHWIFWTFGFVCALIPLGLKNTGFMYTAAIIFPLFVVWASKNAPRVLWVAVVLLSSLAVWFFYTGFDLQMAGTRIAFIRGADATVVAGGYTMSFESYPVADILKNEFWAFAVNQSFSIVALLFCVSAAVLIFCRTALECNYRWALFYILIVAVAMVAIFGLPQLVRQFAENYAAPGSDVGLSRFMLAAGPSTIMSAVLAVRALEKPSRPELMLQRN